MKLTWKAWAALVGLVGIVCFIVFDWSRFLADFWPIDRSFVGPNLVAALVQGVIVLIFVALLYPPLRRWIESQVHEVKEHVTAEHEKLHEKMDHIIEYHPDIPPFLGSEHGPSPTVEQPEPTASP